MLLAGEQVREVVLLMMLLVADVIFVRDWGVHHSLPYLFTSSSPSPSPKLKPPARGWRAADHHIAPLMQGAGRKGRAAGFHTYGCPWKQPLWLPACSDQACDGTWRSPGCSLAKSRSHSNKHPSGSFQATDKMKGTSIISSIACTTWACPMCVTSKTSFVSAPCIVEEQRPEMCRRHAGLF